MSNITKNIITLIIIIAIGIVSYFLLSDTENGKFSKFNLSIKNLIIKGDESKEPNGEDEFNVGKFVTLISNFETIKLNQGIFKNEIFNNLNDSTVTILHDKRNEGRDNPFAPIEIGENKENAPASEDKNAIKKESEKSEKSNNDIDKLPQTQIKTQTETQTEKSNEKTKTKTQ